MFFGPSFTFGENSYWQIFEDWNADPDIANTARELYGDIDRLELYPGLYAEGHQVIRYYCFGMLFTFIVCLSVRLTYNRIQLLPLILLVSLLSYYLFITFA